MGRRQGRLQGGNCTEVCVELQWEVDLTPEASIREILKPFFFLEDGRDVSRIVPFPPNALNTVFFRKKRNGVLPREKVL